MIAFSPFLITVTVMLMNRTKDTQVEKKEGSLFDPEELIMDEANKQLFQFIAGIMFAIWVIVAFCMATTTYCDTLVSDR